MNVQVVNAEVLRVAPGETLIIRVSETVDPELMGQIAEALDEVGLAGRSIVIRSDGVEFAVAQP